jgi:hypothetical protein
MRSASDFTAGLLNWYTVSMLGVVGVCLFLILFMEQRRLSGQAGATRQDPDCSDPRRLRPPVFLICIAGAQRLQYFSCLTYL